MSKILLAFLIASLIFLCGAVAFAAGVPDPSTDPGGFFTLILGAATAKNYFFLVILGSIGVIALLRHVGAKVWPFLAGDTGGAVLAMAYGLLLPIAIVLATSVKLTWALYVGAVMATAASTGLYVWSKKLGRKLIELLGKKTAKTNVVPPT